MTWQCKDPRPWFNIKMSSYQYRKSHCGDKTILWPSYLHSGISYTGKTPSFYWIRDQVISSYSYDQARLPEIFRLPEGFIPDWICIHFTPSNENTFLWLWISAICDCQCYMGHMIGFDVSLVPVSYIMYLEILTDWQYICTVQSN